MSAADWGILVPAVVAFLTAGAAYLKSRATGKQAQYTAGVVQSHIENHSLTTGPDPEPPPLTQSNN